MGDKTGSEVGNLKEGTDYYVNKKGLLVFTRKYLIKRGYCCKSGCQNCPYGYKRSTLLD